MAAICLHAGHARARAVPECAAAGPSTLRPFDKLRAQGAGPRRPIARALALLREWRRRSRDRERLAIFDDRMLSDIGLTRAEAEFLSHKPFWRE
jgi:uncharacterized protein YjiS (DUF1127 family)